MKKDYLQVESGNFTRIVNPVLDELVKIPFKGCELAVAIFIIRKTWGYGKTEDSISLTQFQKGLGRSRQTIVSALKNLQLVNTVRLVKRGGVNNDSNIWRFNKYIKNWNLVNTVRLVKRGDKPSLTERLNLVQTGRHTKENTKEIQKKGTFSPPSLEDVAKYCLARGNGVDARCFLDFYEAKGWMIGKNKMKSWQAAVRTWESRSPKVDQLEERIKSEIKKLGSEQAMFSFTNEEFLKYKHLFIKT